MKFDSLDRWYKKGVQEEKKVTKFRKGACENCGCHDTQEKEFFGGRWVWFRKGACENCGAMMHKKKDCLEVGGCGSEKGRVRIVGP